MFRDRPIANYVPVCLEKVVTSKTTSYLQTALRDRTIWDRVASAQCELRAIQVVSKTRIIR